MIDEKLARTGSVEQLKEVLASIERALLVTLPGVPDRQNAEDDRWLHAYAAIVRDELRKRESARTAWPA